jgi:hypothetical protein
MPTKSHFKEKKTIVLSRKNLQTITRFVGEKNNNI